MVPITSDPVEKVCNKFFNNMATLKDASGDPTGMVMS